MSAPQHTIGSGFGARSTTHDVLRDVDLTGRVAVVTGGYSGLGLETTRALARAGAQVVVPARRPGVAREAVRGIHGAEVDEVQLSDLGSVAAFAERFLDSGRTIDILIANAGIMACPLRRVGPGWEAQFAINHLGHFTLINRLWPAIARGGARVVMVSSGAHQITGIRWEDIHFTQGYDKWVAYGQSKTANVLCAVQLDALGHEIGVRAFAVHPGSILTPLQRHLAREEMVAAGWIDADGKLTDPSFKTSPQGAATQVWAATAPQLANLGGVYCVDCDIAEPARDGVPGGVSAHAVDPSEAARLWTLSAELTGTDALAPVT